MPHLDPMLLSAYLDDEVSVAERARVEQHLPGCPDCSAELESLRQTRLIIAALPQVPVPRPFYLTEAMVRPAPAPSLLERVRRMLLPLGGVAAAAAVLLLAVIVWQGQGMAPGSPDVATEEASIAMSAEEADGGADVPEEERATDQDGTAADSAEAAAGEMAAEESLEATTMEDAAESDTAMVPSLEQEADAMEAATSEAAEITSPAPDGARAPLATGRYVAGLLFVLLVALILVIWSRRRPAP